MSINKRLMGLIGRVFRSEIHYFLYSRYNDNPFRVETASFDRDMFIELARKTKERINKQFIQSIKDDYGFLVEESFIHELALTTQVCIKKSELNYMHGYLLYSSLRCYLADNTNFRTVNILETGTARGFSALVMAKALRDAGKDGRIFTVDILPINKPIFWNCVNDINGKATRCELLSKWRYLIEEYIVFIQGYSDIVLKQIEVPRVHFAFVDGGHDFKSVENDLTYIKERQCTGDIIIIDDFNNPKLPDVTNTVKLFISKNEYFSKFFTSSEKRQYLFCKRI